MEATLQRNKSKKHRMKSKQISKTELELVSHESNCSNFSKNQEEILQLNSEKSKQISITELELTSHTQESDCDNFSKNQEEILQLNSEESKQVSRTELEPVSHESDCDNFRKNQEEILQINSEGAGNFCELPLKPYTAVMKELSLTNIHERNLQNATESIDKNCKFISNSLEEKFHKDWYDSANFAKIEAAETSRDPVSSEKVSIFQKKEKIDDLSKVFKLHMYPDLKCLEYCEQIHNIVSSETLVKTYTEEYKTKIVLEANKRFHEFMKIIHDLDKQHPLMEMILEYQRARKSCLKLCSRIKYLKSDLKRKKDSLWKSVVKEVSSKGKCDDGYTVAVKHTFTIKELDQDKFNEVKKVLKEIEELLLLDAFYSYSEQVMELRIEKYMEESLSDEFYLKENEESIEREEFFLKSISVLFDTQRQNVEDKHYLNACQKWLKDLVSKLMENKSEDNLFVINHVLRCPNGIQNWASELIQVPVDISETDRSGKNICIFDGVCAQKILLTLYLILNPVPLREFFLKNIKSHSEMDAIDGKFTVLDSEGEEEEGMFQSKNWSDADILSLFNQIPITSLYKHFLLDSKEMEIQAHTEGRILKLLAYSTALIDVLFIGLETYYSENFPLLFESISNSIRHILVYVKEYLMCINMDSHFKCQIQAVYDKLLFHIVFKVYNFQKLRIWNILPALPYDCSSEKIRWNIMWIFFCPERSEEVVYSEKDVEVKIKDESVHCLFINHIKKLAVKDIVELLNAIEKMITSNNSEKDFIEFSCFMIFKVTMLEPSLMKVLYNEGAIILSSVTEKYPYLVSVLLQAIHENFNDDCVCDESEKDFFENQCVNLLFKKISLLSWIPKDSDISILSSWLFSHFLTGGKHHLSRLILKNMNWDFSKEGSLFLPYDLHNQIAMIVTEAYLKFDSDNSNAGLISKGVKQMLQFTSIKSEKDEEFVNWAWSILFRLKLHPLDRKYPPWIEVYDGYVEEYDKIDISSEMFQILFSAYESKHPSSCYLMLVMSNEGYSLKNLLNRGLDCFSTLVECEQYMAAIKSLYYILPFFVKNSELLLEKFGFIKAMNNLITADMTIMSNISGGVIGAVLHKIAAMIKHQIYKASEHTVECAAPLLKLWIKILMKMFADNSSAKVLKNSAKQVHFLLDILVQISFGDDYTRYCTLDLLKSYCSPLVLTKAHQPSVFWNKIFSSTTCMYAILNRNTLPEYPWLAWHVLLCEMKTKHVEDFWLKIQTEMLKPENHGSPATCLKKVSESMKVDLEFLPIYRWALQAVETSVFHLVSPLIYQQFFFYYFHKVPLPNSSESYASIGNMYFKNGPYVPLLKKLKKHLKDTEIFYKDLLKTLPETKRESSEGSKSDKYENRLFYVNLLKLFQAFRLWLDDESLVNSSSLCLSALEPKYDPYRLKLILNGDQTIWVDMVSKSSLKYEIDKKVHSWCFNKVTDGGDNKDNKIPSTGQESLPKKIMRHIEKYETILPVRSSRPCSVSEKKSEVDYAFSSKEAVVQMIEENQIIIFDKAKYFCEQMKQLKQLNFNFINWTPQEYEVEDCEISEKKECCKGNGVNGCSGPAFFKLQIQKYRKNERISERIENNRTDYVIIEERLTKLPVNDLCIASLHIESIIRSLANKSKDSKNEGADYFKKMGVSLFYHEISTIDKAILSVADYPPSRQFFSLIVESLGREFIDGNASELMELAKSILNHPEAGSLALPLFNPNKSCIEIFLTVYNILTSSVGKHSSSALLALFSKVDLRKWLNENAPSFDDRKIIFDYICDALYVCGYHPSSDLLPIFDILKRHFGFMVQYMFPDLFIATVVFLLKGAEEKNLSVDVYYEAFHCFGCPLFSDKTSLSDIEFALKKFAQNQQLPAHEQIFVSVTRLNLQQVRHVSHMFYSHFMKKRFSCELYKHYIKYIKPFGIFLAIISHSLVALHLDEILSLSQVLCVKELWETFHLPFCPWLHPSVNTLGLDFPWTNEEELNHARYLFKIFTASLKYFHEQILCCKGEESILSYMWDFYVQTYVAPGHRHYSVSLCHAELLNLPWQEFHPSTFDIEGMCKVLQSNLHESKEFLSKISLKIPWFKVMETITSTKPPDYIGKVLATLGKLLIISQLDCTETDNNLYPSVFKDFEKLSWHFLSIEECRTLLNLYYSCLDPFVLLSNWGNSKEFHVLQFLKIICCMIPNHEGCGEYTNSKRILYLEKFLSTLSAFCKNTEIKKLFQNVLIDMFSSLFDDMEVVICDVNPDEQTNYALPLVKEVIIFLNDLPEGELDMVVLNTIHSWLIANKGSPLLLPVLKAACHNLNSVSHMVALIECCISTRFSDEVLDPHEARSIWQLILSYFCVRSNMFDQFVKKCVEENAYLTLYCCLLIKIPQSDSLENKKVLVEKIIQAIRESKLRFDSEAKFILLLDKFLEICIKLVLAEEFLFVKQELTAFCWILDSLAEDRSNSGLFAIFGLGQVSSLSVNFRFLCRVIVAFIQNQIPYNYPIRVEPMDSSCLNMKGLPANGSSSSTSASKALENLKGLEQKKLYSALQSQIDYAIKFILDPKYTFLQTRELLKYFAVVLYPKNSYLYALDS